MIPKEEHDATIINASYKTFVFLITLLSIINSILFLFFVDPDIRTVLQIVDSGICIFLLIDFFVSFSKTRDRRRYFFDFFGWMDLLGSLPVTGFRFFRLFRTALVFRKVKKTDIQKMGIVIVEQRAQTTLLTILFAAVVVFELASIMILQAEKLSPDANITTASDALWWSYVTAATVGYGDKYPVTNSGRIVGFFVMTAGVGLLSAITSFLADWYRRPRKPRIETTEVEKQVENQAPDIQSDIRKIYELIEQQETSHAQAMEELKSRLEKLQLMINR